MKITVEQWNVAHELAAEVDALDAEAADRLRARAATPTAGRAADAVAGAVLGAAVGDALGHPTEFLRSSDEIRARFGPQGVTGYALYWERGGRRFAPYTDDTQLAEAVLRTLVWSRATGASLDATMEAMGRRFVVWAYAPQGGHRAPGRATLAGCAALAAGTPWREAGAEDAGGCGSVMRAYPFGIVFGDDPDRAERWAVAHSSLTHRAPIALAACAAMAAGTVSALRRAPVAETFAAMIAAAGRQDAETADMIAAARDDAGRGEPPDVVLERLQGWAAHEAIAAAAYLLARHPDDFRAAVLAGANAPGDSDSIASLAGALVGARVGVAAIPAPWVDDLERASDLSELARLAFGASQLRTEPSP